MKLIDVDHRLKWKICLIFIIYIIVNCCLNKMNVS